MKNGITDLRVAAAFMENLTSPDAEDWILLADGDVVHVTAIQETVHGPEPQVWGRYGAAPLSDFKQLVEDLPADNNIGCVMLIMCQDSDDTGGTELFGWLGKQAKQKNFSFTSMFGPASTAEAVRSIKSSFKEQGKQQ